MPDPAPLAAVYWQRLCQANEGLRGEGRMTLSINAFRCAIERAFLAGRVSVAGEQMSDFGDECIAAVFRDLFAGF